MKKTLDRHREADDRALEPNLAEKENERIEGLKQDAAQQENHGGQIMGVI